MKILLGVNLFGTTHRHKLSKESYIRLSKKYDIKLINLQFNDDNPHLDDEHFEIKYMSRSSKDVCDSQKKLPLMKHCFDLLSEDSDYFIFTNDDIIISPTYIEDFLKTKVDCYPSSRLAIPEIKTLEDEIPLVDHYQVSGFDAFIIRSEWWKKNRDKFPDYVLGKPCWDVHYAFLCMRHGDSVLCNKWPPPTFHINHPLVSNDVCPEKEYNETLFWKVYAEDAKIWSAYNAFVLLKRPNNYTGVFENEEQLEKIYFKL